MDLKLFLSICAIMTGYSSAAFNEICLSSHNQLRAPHKDTPGMIWDSDLASQAQKRADHLAELKLLQHDPSLVNIGENLFWVSSITGEASCAEAALKWYNEYKHYNFANPDRNSFTARAFSQLVWKSSVKLGAAIATYRDGDQTKSIIVARYQPAGNTGDDSENVMQRKANYETPLIYHLDPNLCKDIWPAAKCHHYAGHEWCKPVKFNYLLMKSHCARTCKLCG